MNQKIIEYIFIAILSTILGYIFAAKTSTAMLRFQNKIRKQTGIKKYRIHHDLGGILIILVALLLPNLSIKIAVAGFGLGILINHLSTKGLELITKT
jgi:hypothetical protein